MQPDHVTFYDNAEAKYDEDGRRFVDRIYCFGWADFSDDDWHTLGEAYEKLPGWLGHAKEGYVKGCPCWYSLDRSIGSHLHTSVEPPGIQLCGNVTDSELDQWHERFLELTRILPRLDMDVWNC
ncbi:MAG: hypothetical protein JXB07_21985 [Anaerolineae bacterium]|nr:hypothetical protein [Anaerolineae bacterium]